MKIRNFAAVLSLCLVTFGTVQAQSYQTFGKWKKQEGACVAIDVNAPQEIAVETLYNLLHSEKLKGKKSKKELTFENITFPTLSLNYINLYVASSAKSNEITTIQVFVNKGLNADFVSSSSDRDLVQNLMNYLNTKFLPAASQANLAYKMKVQQDKVNKSAKFLIFIIVFNFLWFVNQDGLSASISRQTTNPSAKVAKKWNKMLGAEMVAVS